MPRSIFSMTGVAVILSVLCLAAGYRQQLPSAGFGIESDAGIDAGMHRHILEPCAEMALLHPPPVLLSGNASVLQRGASSLAFTLSRAPSVHVVPMEGFPHKEKIWKEPKMAPSSPLGRLAPLANQAYEELTVFGVEVMLGAAICVGAALQRRVTGAL